MTWIVEAIPGNQDHTIMSHMIHIGPSIMGTCRLLHLPGATDPDLINVIKLPIIYFANSNDKWLFTWLRDWLVELLITILINLKAFFLLYTIKEQSHSVLRIC